MPSRSKCKPGRSRWAGPAAGAPRRDDAARVVRVRGPPRPQPWARPPMVARIPCVRAPRNMDATDSCSSRPGERHHVAAAPAAGYLGAQGALVESGGAHLVQLLVRHAHLGQQLMVLRHDAAHRGPVVRLESRLHAPPLFPDPLQPLGEQLRLCLLLLVDEGVQGGGVDRHAAVGEHDVDRLRDRDLLEVLLLVLEVEEQQASVGGGGVVHAAGDAVIGELPLPGHVVDLLDRVAQAELGVQSARQRDAARRAGAHSAARQQRAAHGDLDGRLRDVHPHRLEDRVDRAPVLLALLLLVAGDLVTPVVQRPAAAALQPLDRGHGRVRDRGHDGRHLLEDELVADQDRLAESAAFTHVRTPPGSSPSRR